MKRIAACLLVLLMLLSTMTLPILATDSDESETVPDRSDWSGITFNQDKKYDMSVLLEDIPYVVEAWIYFPEGFSGYGGVVVGNYGIIQPCFQLDILAGGKPRLSYTNPTDEMYVKDKFEVTFESVNVYTGEWVHLAIVIDDSVAEMSCYLNGELAQTVENAVMFDEDVLSVPFAVGGDHRGKNSSYFRGQIRSLALYSDYRDERKISKDMLSVDTADDDLIAYYDFTAIENGIFSDHTDGRYDLEEIDYWLDPVEVEPVNDYAYSLCLVGDTQIEAYYDPERFPSIYDWLVENAKSQKIAYVMGLGDITDRNSYEEWNMAQQYVSKLNGVVGYSLVHGNHDGIDRFNATFNHSWYTNTCGGFFEEGHAENSWRTFRAGSDEYLVITLEYGPRNDVLHWVEGLLKQYPNHRAIITTHGYMTRDGSRLGADDYHSPTLLGGKENNGEDMWNKVLRKYENVFMVVSGHIDTERVVITQEKGDHGNIVTQMLVNFQGISLREYKLDGALGAVVMLYFNADGTVAEMRTYSTVRELYFRNDNQRTISFVEQEEEPLPIDPEESIPDQSEPNEPTESEPSESDSGQAPSEEKTHPSLPWIIVSAVEGAVILCLGTLLLLTHTKHKRE